MWPERGPAGKGGRGDKVNPIPLECSNRRSTEGSTDLEYPEAPFWEAFGGHFGSFFWNPGFLVFDDPYNENQRFLEARGSQNRSFLEVFFRGRFWEASGE